MRPASDSKYSKVNEFTSTVDLTKLESTYRLKAAITPSSPDHVKHDSVFDRRPGKIVPYLDQLENERSTGV